MMCRKKRFSYFKPMELAVAISIIALFLNGCTLFKKTNPPDNGKNDTPKQLTELTGTQVVLLDKCPISGEVQTNEQMAESGFLSALFGIVGPTLIETGVGALGSAIKKAAGEGDENTSLTGETYDFFYQNQLSNADTVAPYVSVVKEKKHIPKFVTIQNPKTKCVVCFHGKHGLKDPNDVQAREKSWKPESNFFSESHDWTEWYKLQMREAPKFYMEAEMVVPDGRNQFQINPTFILYNEQLNSKGSDKKRDLELRFSLVPSGTSDDKGSTGSIILLDVPAGHFIGGDQISWLKTGFMPKLPKDEFFKSKETARKTLTKNAITALEAASEDQTPTESQQLTSELEWKQCLSTNKEKECEKKKKLKELETKRDKVKAKEARDPVIKLALEEAEKGKVLGAPFKMSVTVTETRDINKWLLAVGEALDSQKKDISAEAAKYIIPSQRDDAELQEQTNANTNNSAYLVAMIDVDIAQKALKAAEESGDETVILTKKKDLIQKKATANAAAITAGKAIPFPEVM